MSRTAIDSGDYFEINLAVLLDQSSVSEAYLYESYLYDFVYENGVEISGVYFVENTGYIQRSPTETYSNNLNSAFSYVFSDLEWSNNESRLTVAFRYTNLPALGIWKDVTINIIDCNE